MKAKLLEIAHVVVALLVLVAMIGWCLGDSGSESRRFPSRCAQIQPGMKARDVKVLLGPPHGKYNAFKDINDAEIKPHPSTKLWGQLERGRMIEYWPYHRAAGEGVVVLDA